jgi:hypothetical protein
LCGVYIPPEKSAYFDEEIFDELENDIVSFASKGNTMILGDFNSLSTSYILTILRFHFYNVNISARIHPPLKQRIPLKS